MYYDNTTNTWDYYTWGNNIIKNINPSDVKINISRPKLHTDLEALNNASEDIDWDWTKDDALVSRSLAWKDTILWNPFSIKQIQNFSQDTTNTSEYKINLWDTAIRESDINEMPTTIVWQLNANNSLVFWSLKDIFDRWNRGDPTLIRNPANPMPKFHNINPVNSIFSWSSFSDIFRDATNLTLNLWLINIPKDINWKIYPFLKYKVEFPTSSPIPNAYYYIKWTSNAWTHDVQILVKKPVSETSIFSDFSIIF